MILILIVTLPIIVVFILSMLSWRIQGFKYSWFITAITGLIIWAVSIVLYTIIPTDSNNFSWGLPELIDVSLYLRLDEISWSYLFALSTFFLSFVLISNIFPNKTDENLPGKHSKAGIWVVALIFLSIGLIACLAGNLLTIVIAWMAMDLYDLFIRIKNSNRNPISSQIIYWFSAKVFSLLFLIWGIALSLSLNHSIDLLNLSPQISFFLIIATGIRLVVMPVNNHGKTEDQQNRNFNSFLVLTPLISCLMVLTHTNTSGMSINLVTIFVFLSSIIALLSSFRWAFSVKPGNNHGHWITTLSAFTLISVLMNKTTASISWGICLVLSGSIILQYTQRNRKLLIIPLIGLFGASALPFSASWYGVEMYSESLPGYLMVILIISQALILFGYTRHILFPDDASIQDEASIPDDASTIMDQFSWINYIWGLVILLIAQYLVTTMILFFSEGLGNSPPSVRQNIPSLIAAIIGLFFVYFWRKKIFAKKISLFHSSRQITLKVFPGYAGKIFTTFSLGISMFNMLLEGRGAFFWALLILTLLISILTRINIGG